MFGIDDLLIVASLGSQIIGALTYKTPKEEESAQDAAFRNLVTRHAAIANRRQAAITIASGISGLPESKFYGRSGAKLLKSNQIAGTSGKTYAQLTSNDSQSMQTQLSTQAIERTKKANTMQYGTRKEENGIMYDITYQRDPLTKEYIEVNRSKACK